MTAEPDAWSPRWSLRFWDWRDRPGFLDAADAPDSNGDAAEPERVLNGDS